MKAVDIGSVLKTDNVEFPMTGLSRNMLEGALETSNDVVNAAVRTLRGETTGEFKEGVDVVQILVDATNQVGQIEALLKVDDEARSVGSGVRSSEN